MMKIKRRDMLAGAAAAGSLAFGPRAQAETVTFKVATGLAPNHPTNIRLGEASKRILAESNGRLKLLLFPNNQLGGEEDLLHQVYSGAVQIYLIGGFVISSVVPMAALDGTGFAFKSYDQVWPAMDGKLGSYIRAAIMKSGLYVTGKIWDLGFREITSSTHPIRTVHDLSGFTIRVPAGNAYNRLFEALGAAPETLQYPEVYSALQTGIVDGQENPVGLIVTSKFYEVQKYCSFTNHMWQGFWCLINQKAWNTLPADLQEIAERNLDQSGLAQRQDLARLNDSYIKTLKTAGIVMNDVDSAPFRERLKTSGYYANARKGFGEEAWSLLEEASGADLG